jgi:ketosteroid isomerase-like protein
MNSNLIATLEKAYSAFKSGDIHSFLELCSDSMTFQIQGKSPLAGKYTRSNFEKDFVSKLQALSGGTFQIEIHDILASNQHATALTTCRLTRGGKSHEYRSVHVWRWDAGKPVAWYEYPRDLYQFDAIWS